MDFTNVDKKNHRIIKQVVPMITNKMTAEVLMKIWECAAYLLPTGASSDPNYGNYTLCTDFWN